MLPFPNAVETLCTQYDMHFNGTRNGNAPLQRKAAAKRKFNYTYATTTEHRTHETTWRRLGQSVAGSLTKRAGQLDLS